MVESLVMKAESHNQTSLIINGQWSLDSKELGPDRYSSDWAVNTDMLYL